MSSTSWIDHHPSDTICLGSRLVILVTKSRQSETKKLRSLSAESEGLLVVYQKCIPTLAETILRIEVGTNNCVFRGEIDLSQVKLTNGEKSNVSMYLLQDGREHPNITVRFEHSEENDETLNLIIKEQVTHLGLQKFVYTGILSTSSVGSTTKREKSSLLQFYHDLGKAINDSHQKIQSLEQELHEKDQSLNSWKETAQSLDRQVWQKEKDRLVHNFLKLWNERQTRAKEQLQAMQTELDATKAAWAAKTVEKRKGRTLKLDEAMANEADGDLAAQIEPIPLDEVSAFATGRKPLSRAGPSILKQEDTISVSTLMKQAKEYEKKKRARMPKASSEESGSDTEDEIQHKEGNRNPAQKKLKRKDSIDADIASKASKQECDKKSPDVSDKAHPIAEGKDGSPFLHMDSDDEALRSQIRAGIERRLTLSSSDEE